jgi:hypothetical protein
MVESDTGGLIALGNALYASALAEAALLAIIQKGFLTREEAIGAIDEIKAVMDGAKDDYPLGPTPIAYASGRLLTLKKRLSD